MSHSRTKIKYYTEGAYGAIDEHYLYCHENKSCDYTTFYDEDGNCIFSFPDTLDGNVFDKMNELMSFSPENNPKIEYWSKEDHDKIK